MDNFILLFEENLTEKIGERVFLIENPGLDPLR
jgi:hypothetical protein